MRSFEFHFLPIWFLVVLTFALNLLVINITILVINIPLSNINIQYENGRKPENFFMKVKCIFHVSPFLHLFDFEPEVFNFVVQISRVLLVPCSSLLKKLCLFSVTEIHTILCFVSGYDKCVHSSIPILHFDI